MKLFFTILLLGQLLMAATIQTFPYNNKEIPFIIEQDRRLPIVTMQLIFTASGSIEDDKKAGLARLSAKLLNEGTKTHGSAKFAQLLESKAIHLSAYAGTETFVVELSSLKEHFPEALTRLQELLADPNLTEETLKKVKTKIIGSIKAKENDFDYIANLNLKKLLFEDSVLAQPPNGTIESIEEITLKDVKSFLQEHLVLSRAIIAIGGDIDPERFKEDFNHLFSLLPEGYYQDLPYFEASDAQKELIEKKETQQAYIYFGAPFYMRVNDVELYKAKVAGFILGSGGFGSRLMEEIRVKKGLAYSAYAHFHINKSNSYFSGYLQTKLDSSDEALKSVKELIKHFVAEGATQEELEQTKRFLLGSEPLRNETMNQRLHRAFMEYYKGYAPDHYKEELQKIEALDLQTLNAFIRKHTEIQKLSVSIITK